MSTRPSGPEGARPRERRRRGRLGLFSLFTGFKLARAAAPHLLEMAQMRAELAELEWADEQRRWQMIGVSAILCAVLGLATLAFAALAVLITAWDTPYRLQVAWGLVVALFVAAIVAALCLRSALHRADQRFALTRAQFAQDFRALRGLLAGEAEAPAPAATAQDNEVGNDVKPAGAGR